MSQIDSESIDDHVSLFKSLNIVDILNETQLIQQLYGTCANPNEIYELLMNQMQDYIQPIINDILLELQSKNDQQMKEIKDLKEQLIFNDRNQDVGRNDDIVNIQDSLKSNFKFERNIWELSKYHNFVYYQRQKEISEKKNQDISRSQEVYWKNEYLDVKKENQQLQVSYRQAKKINEDLEYNLNILNVQNENILQQNASSELKRMMNELENQNQNMMKSIGNEDYNKDQHLELLTEKNNLIEKLLGQQNELKYDFEQQLVKITQDLEIQQNIRYQEQLLQIYNLENDIIELKNLNQAQSKRILDLEDHYFQNQQQNIEENLLQENKILRDQIRHQEQEIISLTHKQKLQSDLMSSAQEQIQKNMKELILKYKGQLLQEQIENEGLKQDNQKLQEFIKQIQIQMDELTKEKYEVDQGLRYFQNIDKQEVKQDQNLLYEIRINQLNTQLEQYKQNFEKIQHQNGLLRKKCQTKIEVLKQKFKEVFFIVLESLQLERESLKITVMEETQQFFVGMCEQIICLTDYFKQLEQQVDEHKMITLFENYKSQIHKHFQQNKQKYEDDMVAKGRILEKEMLEQQARSEIKLNQINTQNKQLSIHSKEQQNMINYNEKALNSIKQSHDNLLIELREKDDIILQYENRFQDQQRSINEKNQLIRTQVDTITKLKYQYEIQLDQNQKLEIQQDNQQKLLNEQQVNMQQKQNRIQELLKIVDDCNYRIQKYEEGNQNYQKQIEQLIVCVQQAEKKFTIEHHSTEQQMLLILQKRDQEFNDYKKKYNIDLEVAKQQIYALEENMREVELQNKKQKMKILEYQALLSQRDQHQYKSDTKSVQKESPIKLIQSKSQHENIKMNDNSDQEYNMIIAKYKFEKFQTQSLKSAQEHHLKRMEFIKGNTTL